MPPRTIALLLCLLIVFAGVAALQDRYFDGLQVRQQTDHPVHQANHVTLTIHLTDGTTRRYCLSHSGSLRYEAFDAHGQAGSSRDFQISPERTRKVWNDVGRALSSSEAGPTLADPSQPIAQLELFQEGKELSLRWALRQPHPTAHVVLADFNQLLQGKSAPPIELN